jgi:large subunit ribosomal protein L10
MAAEKPRPEKVAVVDEVRSRLSSSSAALLTEYRGLKVSELARLRGVVREAGGEYKIYKNTLVRLAVQDLGLAELDELLTGPTAIAFVDGDAVVVARSLRDFARANPNLTIKGGLLGRSVLNAADAGALADVAPRDVLLAQLAGALAAPLQQMAGLLAALPRNFAYGLQALIDRGGGAPAAQADTAGAPAAQADTAVAPAAQTDTAGAPAAQADTAVADDTAGAAAPAAPAAQTDAPAAQAEAPAAQEPAPESAPDPAS